MKCIILILFRVTLDFKRIAGSRHCMHVYATGKQQGYSRMKVLPKYPSFFAETNLLKKEQFTMVKVKLYCSVRACTDCYIYLILRCGYQTNGSKVHNCTCDGVRFTRLCK